MFIKYPRTFHLPWSEGAADDDRMLPDVKHFENRHVIVTEKMDGENTTLYSDGHMHARSLDSRAHESRDWVKAWWATRSYLLPFGWRVCGENVFAKHSIHYTNLETYFYGFSVWDENNYCMGWNDTLEWFGMLNIFYPRVLYNGMWDEKVIRAIKLDPNMEGYVVRTDCKFKFPEFEQNVAKWVRKGHVQTDKHWMHQEIVKNELSEGDKNV